MATLPMSVFQSSAASTAPFSGPMESESVGFRPLEWLAIAIARRDGLSSIRKPSRLSLALSSVLGSGTGASLADPDLEALRRIAVFAWHGKTPDAAGRAQFAAAGYGPAHEELLKASISGDRRTSGSAAAIGRLAADIL